jgi:PAS domain S-box-containing protein
MARLTARKNWAATPLGPRDSWPASLRTLVDTILLQPLPMVILWGPDLVQLYNDAFRPIAGDKHPHALGLGNYVCWPEAADFVRPFYNRVLAGESLFFQDQPFHLQRHGSIEEVFLTVAYSPLKDDHDAIAGILAVCTETTGKIHAERARQKSLADQQRLAEHHRLALAAANLGDWEWDAATDLMALSPRAAELYGVDPAIKHSRTSLRTYLHPGYRQRAAEVNQHAAANHTDYDIEYPLTRPDGVTLWLAAKGRGIYDANGNVVGMRGVIQDITPRKNAEAEREQLLATVQSERARLSAAFMRSPAFMCILRSPEHIFEFVNDQYLQLVGRRDILEKTIRAALPELAGQGFFELLDRVYATAEPYAGHDTEVRIQRSPTGPPETRTVDFVYQPLHDAAGAVTGIFVHGIDITDARRSLLEREQLLESERAARNEAERANRIKDEFLATLSHELRTPLNAIVGWSQILRAGTASPEDLAEGLDTIERNARAQAQIIEDLLDMSRIISGKLRLTVQPLHLPDVIKAAIDTIRPAADAKSLRVTSVLDPAAGPVSGDPNRLQQVLWNLLSNAVKFTPKGGRVQVVLQRINSHVEITVSDSGAGINPEFLPHVFDRFRQADASITRTHGGLGLGLAIVKNLVELHGGTITATSPGLAKGAAFTVSLPLTPVKTGAAAPEEPRPLRAIPPTDLCDEDHNLEGVHILVVDDELDARNVVKRLLEDCKATVATAASAAQALELLQSQTFHLLVSDIGMPGEDGYALIRKIRALAHPIAAIPAVALTAYARAEDRARAMLAGFHLHLAKPVEPTELLTLLTTLAPKKT